MQKNVMVQDAAGQIIGSTYSKRAKGLLKSGRAVLVDDHTIQLCASAQNTAAPISKKELHMEDLLFCAPAFSTKSRFSTLLTVTDADGDPMELWELDATEETTSATIYAQLQQLPKTAYQFRFTLAGSSETERIRCTVQTDTDTKTYALEQGRYQSDSRKNAAADIFPAHYQRNRWQGFHSVHGKTSVHADSAGSAGCCFTGSASVFLSGMETGCKPCCKSDCGLV